MYMLDTSACVDLIRGRASETELPSPSECVLSRGPCPSAWTTLVIGNIRAFQRVAGLPCLEWTKA